MLLFVPKVTDLLLIGHGPGVFLVVKFIKPNNNLFGKSLKGGVGFVGCLAGAVHRQALTNVFVVDDDDGN